MLGIPWWCWSSLSLLVAVVLLPVGASRRRSLFSRFGPSLTWLMLALAFFLMQTGHVLPAWRVVVAAVCCAALHTAFSFGGLRKLLHWLMYLTTSRRSGRAWPAALSRLAHEDVQQRADAALEEYNRYRHLEGSAAQKLSRLTIKLRRGRQAKQLTPQARLEFYQLLLQTEALLEEARLEHETVREFSRDLDPNAFTALLDFAFEDHSKDANKTDPGLSAS